MLGLTANADDSFDLVLVADPVLQLLVGDAVSGADQQSRL